MTNTPADMIAAVAIGRGKGECGKKVRVSRGRKYVDLVIQDLCGACVIIPDPRASMSSGGV